MSSMVTTKFNTKPGRVVLILISVVLAFVALTLLQDYLRATIKNSAFYFSESFMFSSFWWIVAALLFVQYYVVKHSSNRQAGFLLLIILLPIVVQLFAFPALVWVLSRLFYYHTYAFTQTLKYTLSEHAYQLVLLYSIPVLLYRFFIKKSTTAEKVMDTENEEIASLFINTMLVAEGNKKLSIVVSDILYFTASPPYINIFVDQKKYLHTETLKSFLIKLNPEEFVRIHKSTIVNIKLVASYSSRLNGDYDLLLKNNIKLRVSRTFAKQFKSLFCQTHQLTTK